jgi:hypothetical protein
VRGCVQNVLRHDAVSKRKGSASEPAFRSRLPTAVSCWSRKAAGGEGYGKGAARLHPVRVKETRASKLRRRHRNRFTGIQTEAPPLSGKSMAVTYLWAMRCPVYRQRDFHLGFDTELENGIGGGKGNGTSGSAARPKVPIRRSGRDCLVVAWKRGNARGAKGAGHSRQDRCVNRQREEPTGGGGGRQPSLDGRSRVRGDCHARF